MVRERGKVYGDNIMFGSMPRWEGWAECANYTHADGAAPSHGPGHNAIIYVCKTMTGGGEQHHEKVVCKRYNIVAMPPCGRGGSLGPPPDQYLCSDGLVTVTTTGAGYYIPSVSVPVIAVAGGCSPDRFSGSAAGLFITTHGNNGCTAVCAEAQAPDQPNGP
ncbi:hypothetical protein ACI65C_008313 [Semiaphis heraclei]